jgi:hypothetical protein
LQKDFFLLISLYNNHLLQQQQVPCRKAAGDLPKNSG